MSDISEVSKAIGRLEATQEQHGMAHKQIMEKLDSIASLQSTMSAALPQMQTEIDEAVENGRDWKKTKYKGLGFVSGISLIAGTISAQISDLFN